MLESGCRTVGTVLGDFSKAGIKWSLYTFRPVGREIIKNESGMGGYGVYNNSNTFN